MLSFQGNKSPSPSMTQEQIDKDVCRDILQAMQSKWRISWQIGRSKVQSANARHRPITGLTLEALKSVFYKLKDQRVIFILKSS